jgi:hypothetical protein
MAAGITKYHVAEFGSVKAATNGAAALIAHLVSPAGIRHLTGPRRAVIWGEGADAPQPVQERLYLSDGGLEAAREIKLVFTVGGTITAEQLPPTARLLHGEGVR